MLQPSCATNFSSQNSGKPVNGSSRKKKTPSQLRRNKERLEKFIQKKKSEESDLTDLAEYELKMDAHKNCTEADTIQKFGNF